MVDFADGLHLELPARSADLGLRYPGDALRVPSLAISNSTVPSGRMGRIHHNYHNDAPPEVAWAVGRDPNRMPEWNTTTVSVKDVSGSLDRPGATYTTVSKIAGRPLEVRWQVEQVDPSRSG